MTDGFQRIFRYVEDFRQEVSRCRDKAEVADIQDAYSRLNRARNRYEYERDNNRLDPAEEASLRKVFENDNFIEGMLKVRVISEHVEKGGAVLSLPDNTSFEITAASSAAAMFAAPCVQIPDKDGIVRRWDHVEQLNETERRLTRALEKATKASG